METLISIFLSLAGFGLIIAATIPVTKYVIKSITLIPLAKWICLVYVYVTGIILEYIGSAELDGMQLAGLTDFVLLVYLGNARKFNIPLNDFLKYTALSLIYSLPIVTVGIIAYIIIGDLSILYAGITFYLNIYFFALLQRVNIMKAEEKAAGTNIHL